MIYDGFASRGGRGARWSAAWALVAALVAVACGGGQVHVETSPFTVEDAALFDHGVSYLSAPGSLGGTWESDWRESLEGRVQRADAIAVVVGHTYREDITPTRDRIYRLSMTVEREILGDLEESLELITLETDPGFPTVEGREEQILERRFVAFVKWRAREGDAEGVVEAAFHMEPASESVVAEVEQLVERMRAVRTNSSSTVHYN